MSSSIPRSDPPSAFNDQLSSTLDESPVTSGDSTSQDGSPTPASGAPLKSCLAGHTVTASTSEINLTKKSVLFHRNAPLSFRDVTDYGESSDLPTIVETTPKPDQFTLKKSKQITEWANTILASRKQGFQEAEEALKEFRKLSTDQPTIEQLTNDLSIIKDHFTKAKKYAEWVTIKDRLLEGDQELAQRLREKGLSIGSDWSSEQMQEDWEGAKAEPWATTDPVYEKIKTIVPHATREAATNINRNSARQTSSDSQTSPARQEAKPFQESYTSSRQESHEDIVSVPGVGWVDRNKYDIGNVEYNEDGTSTIVDMTGRRYDYPPSKPSNDPSCTVS